MAENDKCSYGHDSPGSNGACNYIICPCCDDELKHNWLRDGHAAAVARKEDTRRRMAERKADIKAKKAAKAAEQAAQRKKKDR